MMSQLISPPRTRYLANIHQVEQLVQGVDWSEAGLKTEDGEAWGAEYDEPADLTSTHQVPS